MRSDFEKTFVHLSIGYRRWVQIVSELDIPRLELGSSLMTNLLIETYSSAMGNLPSMDDSGAIGQ